MRVPVDLANVRLNFSSGEQAGDSPPHLTLFRVADAVHNQVLFWNTYRGRLEPVVWDANGYLGDPERPVDLIRFPTLEVLSCDPGWIHQRNLTLQALLDGSGSAAAQTTRLDELLELLGPDLRADPNLGDIASSQTGFARMKVIPV